jgi:murein DD-endopeptidase MepM/ murein hydrolase activator NlpD
MAVIVGNLTPLRSSLLIFSLLITPLAANAGEQVSAFQGEVLLINDPNLLPEAKIIEHGEFPAAVACRGNRQPCAVIIAIDMNKKPGSYPLSLVLEQNEGVLSREITLEVRKKKFPEQRLTLPPEYVTPDRKIQKRIAREGRIIRGALSKSDKRIPDIPFSMPGKGELCSRFGARRILNNIPKNQHSGVDLAMNTGEKVRAIAPGRVALTGDFYLGGKSVYLDHGSGIFSSYLHLSNIKVKKGELIKSGEVIGLVGSTGRSTGPHLHFAMKVKGAHIDPLHFIRTVNQLPIEEKEKTEQWEKEEVTYPQSAPAGDKPLDSAP